MSGKKGFNIRQNDEGIELNVHSEQFTQWVSSLPKTKKGWVSLQIYALKESDPRGFTHNMMQVVRKPENQI